MMKKKADIERICHILRSRYPDVKTQLDHRNPFQLLVATILSAQCTDRQVNAVTPMLFRRCPDPGAMASASIDEIESLIRSTGFFHNKAKNIRSCSQALLETFDGVVPDTMEKLLTLPGVGRKTANVVLSAAFGVPTIVVDTHVKRISGRLGLTRHTDPTKIEYELMEILPEKEWDGFSLCLIYFGRDICTAKKPKCGKCPLYDLCAYPDKTA